MIQTYSQKTSCYVIKFINIYLSTGLSLMAGYVLLQKCEPPLNPFGPVSGCLPGVACGPFRVGRSTITCPHVGTPQFQLISCKSTMHIVHNTI